MNKLRAESCVNSAGQRGGYVVPFRVNDVDVWRLLEIYLTLTLKICISKGPGASKR